ncbi:MAG: 2-C-methyl-D-erythritol 4-phosphate cytidylyltransferase [Clostridiales bacterium]|nr:2-C-methyl-D-erythritol 4-phosphate cytidylyltransferase [Clostridiales bacterium]
MNIAIIFAGGSGARMGAGIPKQFIEVNGKPIIIHTLDIFEDNPLIDQIYVACKEDCIKQLDKYCKKFMITKIKRIVPGGQTGQDSIYNALCAAKEDNDDDAIVLIHDGVRPCITKEIIGANIESVKEYGSAITCTALYETPVLSEDGKTIDEVPDRSKYYTAQAPQSFRLGDVIKAHHEVRKVNPGYNGIVDTCNLMKSLGKDVRIVAGPRGNIKVTTPEDIFTFRAMIEYRESVQTFGFTRNEIPGKLVK